MGVAGSGKTTVGVRLAERLGAGFMDADDAHPPENVAKMAAGRPLTDEDRWPWLHSLRDGLAASQALVVTCSALKRAYRDVLRGAGGVRFVFLDVDPELATRRVAGRSGHFMTTAMVASQFADLEVPTSDEPDVVAVDASLPLDALLSAATGAVGRPTA